MRLDMAKFVAPPAGEVSPAIAASGLAAVTVDAIAPNYDIEVDSRARSKSMGNTLRR